MYLFGAFLMIIVFTLLSAN